MIIAPHSFKIIYLSHVVDYSMQSQEKNLHMEHSFCLQTRIGEIDYCVLCRPKSIGSQLLETPEKILPDCGRGSDSVISLHVLINVMQMNTDQIVWLYRLERLT